MMMVMYYIVVFSKLINTIIDLDGVCDVTLNLT